MNGVRAAGPTPDATGGRPAELPRNRMPDSIDCAHMLCGEPATAVLLFDPRVATAWLVDVDGASPTGLRICAGHADRFRAPVGWVLSDQRTPTAADAEQTAGGLPVPDPAPEGGEGAGESQPDDIPAAEPAPTPLLSRAFRTTAQALV